METVQLHLVLDAQRVIEQHRNSGRFFEVGETTSFVREEGSGAPVVCMHGVPTSAFIYRRLIEALDHEGLAGVAFDLPGLGLADRPESFDYSWTGLGEFSVGAINALELEDFHLVVHDIGGPIGFEVAAQKADAVQSLTILNTIIHVDEFRPPWIMNLFRYPLIGPAWLKLFLIKPLFRALVRQGVIADETAMSTAEIDAYDDLVKRTDGGRAFLKIMRGFELTVTKREQYVSTIQDAMYPIQVIWGAEDPFLTLDHFGEIAMSVTGVDSITTVPGGHFLQEEHPDQIAREIAELVEAQSA